MVLIDVTFGDVLLPESIRAGIAAVLRRIPTTGPGSWPGGVDLVHVARLLHGGQSGAPAVAQLVVHRGGQRLVRVVKCGSAEEMAREWAAYDRHVRPYTNILCTRIEAASPGAVDIANAVRGEFECVVYDHAAQHAGAPDEDVVLLQDVARAAALGDDMATDRCVAAVTTLLARAQQVFYNRNEYTAEPAALRAFNPELGPDLVVAADTLDAGSDLRLGTPAEDQYRDAVRYPDQVRDGGGLEVGAEVALNDLTVRFPDEPLTGARDGVSVAVEAAPTAFWVRPGVGSRFSVHGRVVETRAGARWQRLAAAFGDLRRTDDGVVTHGVTTADPFAALPHVLDHRPFGRVRAVVHGDANVRNILLVGADPYLIDYARTGGGRPLLTDFAWLEVGLVRDAFADAGHRNLVLLQRCLALACRLLDSRVAEADALDVCLPLVGAGPSRAAFRILFALRCAVRECAFVAQEHDWWPTYLAQLVFAAHRTFKWPDRLQADGAITAGFAVAAVAAEWLPDLRPCRHWQDDALESAFYALADRLGTARSSTAVALAGQLLSEMDGRAGRSARYEQRVRELRAALVRTWLERLAMDVVAEPGDHVLIELSATPVTWQPDADEPVPDGDTAPVMPLAARAEELVLLGGPGAGKTTVARELRRRLALAVVTGGQDSVRAPVLVWARDIARLAFVTPADDLQALVPRGIPLLCSPSEACT